MLYVIDLKASINLKIKAKLLTRTLIVKLLDYYYRFVIKHCTRFKGYY